MKNDLQTGLIQWIQHCTPPPRNKVEDDCPSFLTSVCQSAPTTISFPINLSINWTKSFVISPMWIFNQKLCDYNYLFNQSVPLEFVFFLF